MTISLTRPGIKVLLVDDEAFVAKAMTRILENEKDIELFHCQDERMAIHMLNKILPTVILQDLVMPHIDGLKLVTLYRINKNAKEIPLIVLSANEDPVVKANAFALGANDYMVKLPDKLEVIARIRYHSKAYIRMLQRNEAYKRMRLETEKREREASEKRAQKLRAEMYNREMKIQKKFIDSFAASIATAIDEKSPYTGGHVKRVVDLTINIAESINKTNDGFFKKIFLSEEEIEELKLAAWMHDVGKITIPDHIIDKSSRLETIFDRIEAIKIRFQLIAKNYQINYLEKYIKTLKKNIDLKSLENQNSEIDNLKIEFEKQIKEISEEFQFIKMANDPGNFINEENIDKINKIAKKTFIINGLEETYLTEDEIKNLSISSGSLNNEERKIIENHAHMTIKILKNLPFPENLANVARYAGAHHEKLDGSGYPHGLSSDEIVLQQRIIAIADIFEALTARDRPYKEPMKISKAISIMKSMKNNGFIDKDIFDLFCNNKIYLQYANKELSPEQLDC